MSPDHPRKIFNAHPPPLSIKRTHKIYITALSNKSQPRKAKKIRTFLTKKYQFLGAYAILTGCPFLLYNFYVSEVFELRIRRKHDGKLPSKALWKCRFQKGFFSKPAKELGGINGLMIWTQLIKWIFFDHLIKETSDVSGRLADIASKIPDEPESKDGYLLYYENGLRLQMDLKEGNTIVGSSVRADCIVASPEISPQHAVITRQGENYFITNINPKGKTYINSVLLPTAHHIKIHAGDVITLSGLRMEFWCRAEAT